MVTTRVAHVAMSVGMMKCEEEEEEEESGKYRCNVAHVVDRQVEPTRPLEYQPILLARLTDRGRICGSHRKAGSRREEETGNPSILNPSQPESRSLTINTLNQNHAFKRLGCLTDEGHHLDHILDEKVVEEGFGAVLRESVWDHGGKVSRLDMTNVRRDSTKPHRTSFPANFRCLFERG